jgi:DnaJ-class molecular chaperone
MKKTKYAPCPDCQGTGKHTVKDSLGRERDAGVCTTCGGTGKVPAEEAEAA